MRSLLAALAVTVLAPALAHADQCAIVDKKVLEDAWTTAKISGSALEFCEPCGDKAPGKPFPITSVRAGADRLLVNGTVRDLAYFYVKTGPKEFKNLGIATACGASGVSEYIRDGKPSGPTKLDKKWRTVPGSPPPPPPPMPPSSSMPRATAPDELVGTWNVKVTTWLSSCPARAAKGDETWFIDLAHGSYSITTSDNLAFEGTPAPLTHGMFTHSLKSKQLPSSTVVKLSQSFKDRFYGSIVRAEPSGGPNDPVCVMQLNVSGTRQP